MKNEEAIMILKAMIDEMILVFDRDRKKALNMAIEALKAQSKHDQNTMSKQPDLETFGVKTGETCEDVISRRDAIDAIKTSRYLVDAMEKIIRLPPAQPEITHCKDCIHWINKHLCEIWSRYGTIETKPDFYCGFGERINNE